MSILSCPAPTHLSIQEILNLSRNQSIEIIVDGDKTVGGKTEFAKTRTNVFFKKFPSDNRKSSNILPPNSKLSILSNKEKGWYLVEYKGEVGYVSKRHVIIINE